MLSPLCQSFKATHREAVDPIVVIAIKRGAIVVQVAVVGVSSAIRQSGPEVRVVAAIVERAIGIAVPGPLA